jgi:hypothetical protein
MKMDEAGQHLQEQNGATVRLTKLFAIFLHKPDVFLR